MLANPCIRCGKQRVDGKVWTEMDGHTLVTHTQTVCPDPACQKIVEEEIAARREKKELLINQRKSRIKQAGSRLSQGKQAHN